MDFTKGPVPLQPVHEPPFTVEAPGYPKVAGETIPRRHAKYKDGLVNTPADGVHTVFDIICRSARLYPDNHAVGYRKLIKLYRENKKVQKKIDGQMTQVSKEWLYYELSPFSYFTYREYKQLIIDLGCGLRYLGLEAGKKLHFFSTTSVSWISLSHACASQSITIATAYDTLGAQGLEHSLTQTECEVQFIDRHLLPILSGTPIESSNIKTVIVNEECIFGSSNEVEEFKKSHPHIKVITYQELLTTGQQNPVGLVPAKGADLYCIMYTSGSSGVPKGACITHQSLVAGVAGLYTCVDDSVSDKERVLAYLPLAHILELALENLVFFIGGTLGYGSPQTLSDNSVKNCKGDMRDFKPTVMVGVPQVWETIRKGIAARLETSNPILRSLFWATVSYKSFLSRNRFPGAFALDGIVFSKVRELTGGQVRFTMNGGSGISDKTKEFISLVVAPMLTGYGLTETSANGALGSPLEYTPHAIGPVPGACDAKLVSIPDLGYSVDSQVPQGEIWLKGMPLMTEYFKNPEETSKVFTPDGWLKTGDIGEFDTNGHLRVIDRIKNLVKMQGGEYIALEKVEAVYRGNRFISNIMVQASADFPRPIAVIMPNEKVLADKAKELDISEDNMHSDRKVRSFVLRELQMTGRGAGLSEMEIISSVVITNEEWTPSSGLVMATQKLNRRALRERFKQEIDLCFNSTA